MTALDPADIPPGLTWCSDEHAGLRRTASGKGFAYHDAKGELIRQMTVKEARKAMADGVATGGMIPKLETAIAAVEAGVGAVVIMDGRRPHAMLVELFTEHGAGTLICE